MQVFYAPDIAGDHYILDRNESKHLVRVLRTKPGALVNLIDGKGNLFEGVIETDDPYGCRVAIKSVVRNFEKRSYRLHIAISPLRNPERFEWFIEKAVEIGIDEITPLICKNTEKPGIKTGRINNLIISAMKQSLKAKMTVLNEVTGFSDFIKSEHGGILMQAHCHSAAPRKKISEVYTRGSDALIMIGPEGDFTPEETELASGRNYVHIHLGGSRLRTETAGVAACHSVYFINQ
ncbi:MAG: 16S rRNA (uracil(1498)-N(3))-methyltransferase [Bacteroidales bacterium]|jgi:16S rRNA (uracil1498-N3)-methyltransferase|nr:16S rRNA (uracil(1498)-N(3))-methyltransferase [Bacteroidales bacterium]